jgi:hypothetical protein
MEFQTVMMEVMSRAVVSSGDTCFEGKRTEVTDFNHCCQSELIINILIHLQKFEKAV